MNAICTSTRTSSRWLSKLLLLQLPGDSPLRKPILTVKRSGEKAARIVEDLLCRFTYRTQDLCNTFPDQTEMVHKTAVSLMKAFPECFYISDSGLELRSFAHPLVRIIANHIDAFASPLAAHSAAI